jgi:hypothetical protein
LRANIIEGLSPYIIFRVSNAKKEGISILIPRNNIEEAVDYIKNENLKEEINRTLFEIEKIQDVIDYLHDLINHKKDLLFSKYQ